MAVMDEEIGVKGGGGKIIDAAGAVGDVSEDEAAVHGGEGGEDVGDDERVHEEAFGELESNALGVGGADAPDGFVNFEAVV